MFFLSFLGYLFYGRLVERVFGIDENRPTPAQTMADGVDYVPMKPWKLFLIQFLNIAGVGPICGAIMGAQFGTASYLWIVFGCIFGGAVHDYMSGMISLRDNGCVTTAAACRKRTASTSETGSNSLCAASWCC